MRIMWYITCRQQALACFKHRAVLSGAIAVLSAAPRKVCIISPQFCQEVSLYTSVACLLWISLMFQACVQTTRWAVIGRLLPAGQVL